MTYYVILVIAITVIAITKIVVKNVQIEVNIILRRNNK